MFKGWQKRAGLWVFILILALSAGCSSGGSGGANSGGSNTAKTPASTQAPDNKAEADKPADSKPAEMTRIKFSEVIRSIFYAPHYVALEKGFYREQGLDVDMNTAQGSDKGAAALLAGTADISLIGPETTIYIHNQQGGKKIKVFHQLTSTDGSFLLSRSKIDNFKWSDLEGKTVIGWRPGSAPQMVLHSVMRKNKVGKVDVVTNIAAPAMAGAFTSGKGDFIQLYEPVASQLEQSGKAFFVASMGEAIGRFPETSFVATDEFIKKNPDVIQRFSNAVVKATKWINETPESE